MPLLDVSHPCALECVNDLHLFMLHHSRATFSCFFFQACKNGRRPTRASTRFSWFSRLTCAKILFNRLMNMCRQEKWYLGTIMDRQSVNQILAHLCTLWCLFFNEILMWLAATTVLYFKCIEVNTKSIATLKKFGNHGGKNYAHECKSFSWTALVLVLF